jgi:hypothetical protein
MKLITGSGRLICTAVFPFMQLNDTLVSISVNVNIPTKKEYKDR